MLTRKVMTATLFAMTLVVGSSWACGDAAKGEELAVDCADCHGDDFLGDEDIPGLAGQNADDLVKAMKAFKSGERVDEAEMMIDYVGELSDQDMADLAAYFSALPGK